MTDIAETLLKVLDPEDVSTGGGSAAAMAGAMAGALVAMVARLSSTAQDVDGQSFYTRIYAQPHALSQQLTQGSQADAQAYQSVRQAYQLSSQTVEEKAARRLALQTAWREATRVPLDNAECCLRVYALGAELNDRANPRALSDLKCANLLARAGLLGCLENVKINLPSIKDPAAALPLAERADYLSQQLARFESMPSVRPATP
jgi:methenyltetrahydrofolate cyclohydrolase